MKSILAVILMLLITSCSSTPEPVDLQTTVDAAVQATWVWLTTEAQSALPTSTHVPMPTPSATSTPFPPPGIGSQRLAEIDGMTQVFVPEGAFLMGSPDGDPDAFPHERPQHSVWLDSYWLDQTEVTNAMYAGCVSEGACQPPRSSSANTYAAYYGNPVYDTYPVIWVDWSQAQAYCQWAGRRLPTEAEWEKAARGTVGQYYPWGNDPLSTAILADFQDVSASCSRAHYAACEPYRDTVPVGERPAGASPFGALDMAGNVWEWVADWYAADTYQSSPESNPYGPEQGTQRVLRGGSFAANFSRDLRSAHRYPMAPDQTIYAFGIRCAETQEYRRGQTG